MSPSPTAERTVLLIGTLDTKGDEFAFLRERLRRRGRRRAAGRRRHARAAERRRPTSRASRSPRRPGSTSRRCARPATAAPRSRAMAGAAAALARRLYDEGRIHGVLSAGGSGNTAIATAAMQALPVGVPKLMVSTMAAGDTTDYVGGVDVALMPSVTDVAGLNSISARILGQRRRRDGGDGARARAAARGRPAAGRGDDVRRHHPVRHARARGARAARLRGARLPRHRHRRQGHGGAGGAAACSPGSST